MPLSMIDFDTHKAYLGGTQLSEVWLGSDLIYKAEKMLVGDGINLLGTTYYNIAEYGEAAFLYSGGIKALDNGYYQLSGGVANNWGNFNIGFNGSISSEDYEYLKLTYTVTSSNISSCWINGQNLILSPLNQERELLIPTNGKDVSVRFSAACHANTSISIIFKVTLE